ncbi:unnamed protein product [Caenorhabditis nigoni]
MFSLLISVSLAQSETRMKRWSPRWWKILNVAHGNTRTTQPSRNLSFDAFSSHGSSALRFGDGGGFRR